MFFLLSVWATTVLTFFYAVNSISLSRKIFKFIFSIFLFACFMSLLVLTNSIIVFFLAWEGMGVCSYFLINYWSLRSVTTSSATKVMIMNSFADILLFMVIVFFTYSLNIFYFSEIGNISTTSQQVKMVVFFMFLTAVCKSAQFPFTSWLLTAMEGPTPVSALMHAATLVTAGCILLMKFNSMIQSYLYVLLISSLLTAIYCSLRATLEFDFKKMVALSTAAQMSIVFLIMALNKPKLAITYLTVHALFKSLLFWIVGFSNHQNWTQNLVKFYKPNCFILYGMLVVMVTLAGLPLFSVYFFKELLLCLTMEQSLYGTLIVGLIFILELQSTVYAFRILKYLMYAMECRTTFLNSSTLTSMPTILYSCSVLLIGSFLNIKLYNNNLILITESTGGAHLTNIIFLFYILLLSILVTVTVWKVLLMVCGALVVVFSSINWLRIISSYKLVKNMQFPVYQLMTTLKTMKCLQLISIKKMHTYLLNLWSGVWMGSKEDEELYALTILTLYFVVLAGLFAQFIPHTIGRLLMCIVGTLVLTYAIIEFDSYQNEYAVLLFFLIPFLIFMIVFVFTCSYWHFSSEFMAILLTS